MKGDVTASGGIEDRAARRAGRRSGGIPWLVDRWRERGRLSPEQRRAVLDAVALRPSATWTFRFAVLQGLSVVIAVMGLVTNSAAVVIGAMLVAPLMGPIMGISASLAMTWGARAVRSTALVVLAAVGSVGLAYLLSAVVPGNGLLTDEVLARTAPGATDLVIALAAGLAGAYATVRPEVSSSLPGVAVAVALVPPLAAVGVTWQAGEIELAIGALMLFVTNLAAIVFAGLLVFPATGFVPVHRMRATRSRLALQVMLVTLVVGSLGVLLTGRTMAAANQAEEVADARRLAASWLAGSGLELTEVTVTGDDVTIAVSGPEPPPEPSVLARQMVERLGPDTHLEIQWLQRSSVAANGSGVAGLDAEVVAEEVAMWLAETGLAPEQFTVDVAIEGRTVTLAISGPSSPPDSRTLERRLASRLGTVVPVAVEATVVVPDAADQAAREVVLEAAGVWAATAGLVVAAVTVDGDVVTVDVEGPAPPPGSRALLDELTAALGRPVELTVRHRPVVTVPVDPEVPPFRWPLDCSPGTTTGPVLTGATESGFTASSLGRWLEARLQAAGLVFTDDGSSFAAPHIDGTLHLWAGSPAQFPGPERADTGPSVEGWGPRAPELRTARAGGVVVLAAVVPHRLDQGPVGGCLPSTADLDRWFDNLIAGADAVPFTGVTLPSFGDTRLFTTAADVTSIAPENHVLALATRAGLPVAIDAAGQLWARTASGDQALLVTTGHVAADSERSAATRRAGGLTISFAPAATSLSPESIAVLEQLGARLRTAPFVGQPPPASGQTPVSGP